MFGLDNRQLKSFLLPISAILVIPFFCLSCWPPDPKSFSLIRFLAGMISMSVGFIFLTTCVIYFKVEGGGTLAPWAPPQKLVIRGPYAYTRNPMLSGVLMVIFGQTLLLSSWALFVWLLIFCAVNTIYFVYSEEPGLERRFGDEYRQYKQRVPRWLPRFEVFKCSCPRF